MSDMVERVARIIDPSSWRVMDSEKASMLRKYKGQNVGWPSDQFQHKESMAKAQEIIAAMQADAAPVAWMPIETAPKDGTAFQATIPGHGSDNVICWADGLMDSHGEDCGSWVFASEQEPPECWTDGYCWAVNEDGVPSVRPTHWMPLPTPPIDDRVSTSSPVVAHETPETSGKLRDALEVVAEVATALTKKPANDPALGEYLAAAVIEADRAALVAEIVGDIRATMCDCSGKFIADEIEAKWGGK